MNMSIIERARALRAVVEQNAEAMTDTEALETPELFPNWHGDGVDYVTGQRMRFGGVLYKVLTDHTSQEEWTPEASPSLFAKVLIPDPDVIPEWEQPDSTNPYMTGDKVTHNGQTWVSTVDNNVWEPGAYGWEAVAE